MSLHCVQLRSHSVWAALGSFCALVIRMVSDLEKCFRTQNSFQALFYEFSAFSVMFVVAKSNNWMLEYIILEAR